MDLGGYSGSFRQAESGATVVFVISLPLSLIILTWIWNQEINICFASIFSCVIVNGKTLTRGPVELFMWVEGNEANASFTENYIILYLLFSS